ERLGHLTREAADHAHRNVGPAVPALGSGFSWLGRFFCHVSIVPKRSLRPLESASEPDRSGDGSNEVTVAAGAPATNCGRKSHWRNGLMDCIARRTHTTSFPCPPCLPTFELGPDRAEFLWTQP